MLVEHHIRDHHIADAAVERRRLAKYVDALHLHQIFQHLAQHPIGCHPQRIVDVDDDAAAIHHPLAAGDADARVEVVAAHLGQIDHLHVDLQTVLRAEVPDTALLLLHRLAAGKPLARGGALILARHVIEVVLPVTLRAILLQLLELLRQKGIGARHGEAREFIFAAAHDA